MNNGDEPRPDRSNKKYQYYHKKSGKIMFNSKLFADDFQVWMRLVALETKKQ